MSNTGCELLKPLHAHLEAALVGFKVAAILTSALLVHWDTCLASVWDIGNEGSTALAQFMNWLHNYLAIEERELRSRHMHSYGIQARTTFHELVH